MPHSVKCGLVMAAIAEAIVLLVVWAQYLAMVERGMWIGIGWASFWAVLIPLCAFLLGVLIESGPDGPSCVEHDLGGGHSVTFFGAKCIELRDEYVALKLISKPMGDDE